MTKNKRSSEKTHEEASGRGVVPKGYRNGIDYLLRTSKETLPEK